MKTKTGEGGCYRLAVETEEERRASLEKMVVPNCSGWPWRQRKKNGMDLIWI